MPLNSRISRCVFKLLLLCIYGAFFSVQGYLRFTNPLTDLSNRYYYTGSYGHIQYGKTVKGGAEVKATGALPKSKKSGWLNKRFSPQPVIKADIPVYQPERFYSIVHHCYEYYQEHIIRTAPGHASLRAPPVVTADDRC